MSDGQTGYGASLAASDGTATTTFGNIISISGPNQERDSVDISTMDSTSKWREFLPGMLNSGELTAELNYDSTAAGTANDLSVALTSGTQTWTISFGESATASNCSSFACVGFMTGLGYAIPFDDKVTQSVSLKFTGAPTYTDQS